MLDARQAVILMLEHGKDGSQGLILNKRTEHRMREVLGAEMLCPEFGDNALYLVRFRVQVLSQSSPPNLSLVSGLCRWRCHCRPTSSPGL